MADLRSFIFIDQLQPQTMCYLGTWIRGRLPRANMAAQVIEISPGLDIEPLTDVALKSTDVQAGILGQLLAMHLAQFPAAFRDAQLEMLMAMQIRLAESQARQVMDFWSAWWRSRV